jgi:hypothetical protein
MRCPIADALRFAMIALAPHNVPSSECRPDDCAMRRRCLPPAGWQAACADWPGPPEVMAPSGYEADGPWEPYTDGGTYAAWKRRLRKVKP